MFRFASLLSLLALAVACGPRAPGPAPSEFGRTFFWRVHSSEIEYGPTCTDNPELRSVDAPEIGESSFLMYALNDEGTEAIHQSCDRTRADSCEDGELIFAVQGDTLVAAPDEVIEAPVEGTDCVVRGEQVWTLEDRGETLEAEVSIQISLQGTSCPAHDASIRARSGNGQGLDGCEIRLRLGADFHSTDR